MKKRKPADEEADDERPKKKKSKPAKSNLLLFALIGGGLSVVLLGCAGHAIGGYFLWGRSPSSPGPTASKDAKDNPKGDGAVKDSGKDGNPKINPAFKLENWGKLADRPSRKEAEQILGGSGETISLQQANQLLS